MLVVLTLGLAVVVAGFGVVCYLAGREDILFYSPVHPLKGMEKRIMAQLDDLKAALDTVGGKVTALVDGVASVGKEVDGLLVALQEHPAAPDLGDVIARAQGIAAQLDTVTASVRAIGDAIPDAAPAAPAPAPPAQ